MSGRQRLDVLIAQLGLAESREKAKAYIMSGSVYVNGVKAVKPGDQVNEDAKIEVRAGSEFVSRGGYKLKKAIASFGLELSGKICVDVGASTGGFTDCMLKNGASRVYSVDVGYGQLAWSLRTDERVVNLERTNIRYLTEEQIPERADFISVDVSFISLRLVLGVVKRLLKDDGLCVCLVKPQFEAGREKVGKKGVVRDVKVHKEVISAVCGYALDEGFTVRGLDYSPIKGPEGNIEYLLYLAASGDGSGLDLTEETDRVTEASHAELDV